MHFQKYYVASKLCADTETSLIKTMEVFLYLGILIASVDRCAETADVERADTRMGECDVNSRDYQQSNGDKVASASLQQLLITSVFNIYSNIYTVRENERERRQKRKSVICFTWPGKALTVADDQRQT